jgi:DNA helicase IV
VVIDWRAPVAEAFYQASWDDPWELERRRSFL